MNLVIGDTSQLSYFFPKKNYQFISSRNINFKNLKNNKYKNIYLTFAEQRTYLNENLNFFTNVNVEYTLDVIHKMCENTEKFIVYSTSELWNNCEGPITIDMDYNYNYTHYIKSKELLCNEIKINNNLRDKVIIIYPFNFNSTHRKEGFLFSKIYDSILNEKKVSLGNVNFERDLIHPKIIVNKSISIDSDILIGSGNLINVKKFIEDIFIELKLDISKYITFNEDNFLDNKRKNYFSSEKLCTYDELLRLTINDIKKILR